MGEDGAAHNTVQAPTAEPVHETEKSIPPPKPIESRKSTWAVSAFDVQASGMATPLGTHSRRSSGIELEDYFVSTLP